MKLEFKWINHPEIAEREMFEHCTDPISSKYEDAYHDVEDLVTGHAQMMVLQADRDGQPFVSYIKPILLYTDESGLDVIQSCIDTLTKQLMGTTSLQRTTKITIETE